MNGERTEMRLVTVNDDVVLSFYFSAANILHYQIMHTFLLHMHNNRCTIVFNRCKCLMYLWHIFSVMVNQVMVEKNIYYTDLILIFRLSSRMYFQYVQLYRQIDCQIHRYPQRWLKTLAILRELNQQISIKFIWYMKLFSPICCVLHSDDIFLT
jgi:hypothetical protein